MQVLKRRYDSEVEHKVMPIGGGEGVTRHYCPAASGNRPGAGIIRILDDDRAGSGLHC